MTAEPAQHPPRLYFDEDVDARLARSLVRRGWHVETAASAGLLGISDEEQLRFAATQQRVLVTHNVRDFPALDARWGERGEAHWGIVVLVGPVSIGLWLRRLEAALAVFGSEDWRNRLVFLGAEYDRPRDLGG